jgi:hypothetical protein
VKQLTEIATAIAKVKSLTLPAGSQSSSVSAPKLNKNKKKKILNLI